MRETSEETDSHTPPERKFPQDLERVITNTIAKIAVHAKGDQGIKVQVIMGDCSIRAEVTQSRNGVQKDSSKTTNAHPQLTEQVIIDELKKAGGDTKLIKISIQPYGYFVKATKRLGDDYDIWKGVMNKLGGSYVRYDSANRDETGGWKFAFK